MSEQTPHSDSKPASGSGTTPTTASGSWRSRTRTGSDTVIRKLGRFQILSALGKGAFGEVWRAYDPHLDREVALKIPRFEDTTGKEAERFFREARAAAQLQHPNIVAVHDAGQAEGQFYIASTFIDGLPLSVWLKENTPTFSQTAEIIRKLAEALHYAHSQGIFHRDIKPANVMITSPSAASQGEPPLCPPLRKGGIEGGYEPHLMDFGLARRTDQEATMTTEGAVLGTPSYMSPEQAKGQSKQADARSDLYSLGVVLYEMLAGRKPFDGVPHVVINKVIHEEPEPPRKINPKVPLDLETITQKCMAKEPERRYPSAQHLADELRRWLNDEPIQARAAGRLEKARLWCRRNPVVAGLAAAVALALFVGTAVSVYFAIEATIHADDAKTAAGRADEEKTKAQLQEARARQVSASLALDRGLAFCEQGDVDRGMLWLVRALELLPPEMKDLEATIRANLADWRGQVRAVRMVFQHEQEVNSAAFSPDGETILVAERGAPIRFWDVATGTRLARDLQLPTGSPYPVETRGLAVSPDGRLLLTGGTDKTARLWELATGKPIGEPWQHEQTVRFIQFNGDGKLALTIAGQAGQVWHVDTGKAATPPMRYELRIVCGAISPDGKQVFLARDAGKLEFWESGTRTEQTLPRAATAVVLSPDGEKIIRGTTDTSGWMLHVTNAWNLNEIATSTHPGRIDALACHPDGKTVLLAGRDGTARICSTETGQLLGSPFHHQGSVRVVAFSRDGHSIMTGSANGAIRVWDVTPRKMDAQFLAQEHLSCVGFMPDGKSVLVGGRRGLLFWNPSATGEPRRIDGWTLSVTASPDGKTIYQGGGSGIRAFETSAGKNIGPNFEYQGQIVALAVSPDQQGLFGAAANWFYGLSDSVTGKRRFDFLQGKGQVRAVAFSPDGGRFLTGDQGGEAWIRDTATGKGLARLTHESSVMAVAFTPDGKTALTATLNTGAFRWDVETGKKLGQPLQHPSWFRVMAFSPDGTMLLTGGHDGTARLWNVATGKTIFQPIRVTGSIGAVAFRPDGKAFALASSTGAWFFQVPQAVTGDVERLRLWVQVITGKEMDENGIVNVLDGNTWHQRRQRLAELGGAPIP